MDDTTSRRIVTCGHNPHVVTIEDRFADAHPMTCPFHAECECGMELGWFKSESSAWKAAMMHGAGLKVTQDAEGGAY